MKRFILAAIVAGSFCSASALAAVSLLGEYQLIEFVAAGESQPLPSQQPLTLQLKKGGEVAGFAGCNRYMGFIQPVPLDFGKLASARKLCGDEGVMQREARYLQALEGVRAIKQDGRGGLVLSDDNGNLLRYQMRTKPVEKIIWIAPEKKPCSHGVMKAECLQYKKTEGAAWQYYYGNIIGFEWEQGKTYKLKVREEKVINPPADASAIKTTLIEVLETK